MIEIGDTIIYHGRVDGAICRGIAAERAISPLTGNVRIRVVDFASEMLDPEAGIWRGIEGDIIAAYPPEQEKDGAT